MHGLGDLVFKGGMFLPPNVRVQYVTLKLAHRVFHDDLTNLGLTKNMSVLLASMECTSKSYIEQDKIQHTSQQPVTLKCAQISTLDMNMDYTLCRYTSPKIRKSNYQGLSIEVKYCKKVRNIELCMSPSIPGQIFQIIGSSLQNMLTRAVPHVIPQSNFIRYVPNTCEGYIKMLIFWESVTLNTAHFANKHAIGIIINYSIITF